MKRYRTYLDSVADILTISLDSYVTTAKIFHGTTISYSRLKGLLNLMLESGLLEAKNAQFKATEKGVRFLALYTELLSLIRLHDRKSALNNEILGQAKETLYSLKQLDKESGLLILEGRSRMVLLACMYYMLSKKSGHPVTLQDVSRIFKVSSNAVSRSKIVLEHIMNLKDSKPPKTN